ncbi:hypothetical protein D8I35_02490 [Corticibacter populi]|uniref:LysM domain-containing protein n=1 Tax=Corticibacter populi TaxID=1550736 RepID=A0A3M6QYD2_9BURK|nr:FimV/HubP family polar landmark protein [Corticibacter populi]RMX08014.1 hypothetical protein D8I35_02490 [Corticibacter populi]RZS35257.1 pilus assembly protein FimV [Corticibacter populi]
MAHTYRWKPSALAVAVLMSTGLHLPNAAALTLGQIQVQSALGQPLSARIPVSNLTPDEAQTLRANPASPDVFNAHGATYSAVMTQLVVQLQRHADGSAYLELRTQAPVSEPFLDLVLNTSWNGGSAVRSYAVLLDPPAPQTRAAVPPAAATAAAVPQAAAPAAVPRTSAPAAPAPAFAPTASPRAQAPVGDDVYERARNWLEGRGQQVSSGAVSPRPAPAPRPARAAATPRSAEASQTTARPAAPTTASGQVTSAVPQAAPQTITTRRGDTAGQIARRHLPANVSLDQMLVALQRANPNAFLQNNVNLLRSGARLDIPALSDIQAISAQEARSIIVAQTRDFNDYRNRVARTVPQAPVSTQAQDVSSGTVQPVREERSEAPAADVLELSTPASGAASQAEEAALAQQRQQQEDAERLKEQQDNIQRLQELRAQMEQPAPAAPAAAASATPPANAEAGKGLGLTIETAPPLPLPDAPSTEATTAAATPAAAPSPTEPEPAPAAGGATPETAAVPADAAGETGSTDGQAQTGAAENPPSTTSAVETPVAAPAAPVAAPPAPAAPVPPPPRPAPPPPPPPGLLDDYPMLPYAGGLLALLLAGYGYYRYRKGRGEAEVVYENSGNVPDSFFAHSSKNSQAGTQSTKSATTGLISTGVSSMDYSPSQIDATGEGDPVLEADVLLAYGRDQQAEEVLKEAEQSHPTRVAIKTRLAEIYAARQDRLSFEVTANEVARLTQRSGAEWIKVAELGRNLDPSNALYQVDEAPAAKSAAPASQGEDALSGFGPLSGLDVDFQPSTLSSTGNGTGGDKTGSTVSDAHKPDLDLDLDLGEISPSKMGDLPPPAPPAAAPKAGAEAPEDKLEFDFLPSVPGDAEPASPAPQTGNANPLADLDLDLDLGEITPSKMGGLTNPADLPQSGSATFVQGNAGETGSHPFDATASDNLQGHPTEPAKASEDPFSLELPNTDLAPAPLPDNEQDTRSLELDLSALDLDGLDNASTTVHDTSLSSGDSTLASLDLDDLGSDDPLTTKLALAREFNTLGDAEGARALVKEVLAQASGELKDKAQQLLKELG